MTNSRIYGASALYVLIDEMSDYEAPPSCDIVEFDREPAHVQTLEKIRQGQRDKRMKPCEAALDRLYRKQNQTSAQKRAIAKRRKK